ncbi:MAG: glycosyltransferase family 1 protein [Methylovulum sp.]|nr:glycosyltransferase family 1 protein [Methylovulum sp.]
MQNIVIDCEKMKYPNTGFYFFCKNLATNIIQQANAETAKINLYLPKQEQGEFNYHRDIIATSSLHKFYMPNMDKIDIWHSTTQMSRFLPLNKKTRIILTIHDLNFLYEKSDRPELINKQLGKIQKKINKADEIVAISEYVKNDILSHLNTGNKKITVIHNGCNAPPEQDLIPPIQQPQQPFLFVIGAINAKKNFHVLPALLKFNHYDLVISGITESDAYKQKIIDEAVKNDVLQRIIFTGPISDNDKYWYFKNCAAFVFPSLAEGFGLPVVEAMYFGKPVFLSAKTSLPEIGGEVAFYFDNFEAGHMQKVFNEGMRQYQNNIDLAKMIKEQSISFCWKKAADQYIKLYNALL